MGKFAVQWIEFAGTDNPEHPRDRNIYIPIARKSKSGLGTGARLRAKTSAAGDLLENRVEVLEQQIAAIHAVTAPRTVPAKQRDAIIVAEG